MKGLPEDLKTLLLDPRASADWPVRNWSRATYLAQSAGLLSRISVDLASDGLRDKLDPGVAGCLLSAERNGLRSQIRLSWEIDRIKRVFRNRDTRIVLLKGAAYLAAGIPCTRGRLSSDIDILVAREELPAVEAALLDAGWKSMKQMQGEAGDYDDRYYRRWMHELPPLMNEERGTIVDVHHTILPPTGRVTAEGSALLEAAVPVPSAAFGLSGYFVLCDTDMFLHSAVHLFQDGEIRGGLRDLVDQCDMIACFGERPGFWDRLVERAEFLGLGRPLFYCLRYASTLLDAPVPGAVLQAVQRFGPPLPVVMLMDLLVPRALAPGYLFEARPLSDVAGEMLYIRSHWLRMPPTMLARHLAVKAWRRLGAAMTA